ncbi:porin family protein [Flavobacterium sp.]|uniref:porin family protein n=1 Tax=Flavobacterium sp. TaxID=239 RepID=UPI002B4AD610|nr:porin family protein [Flavobacterium sp.]HLP65361.1 porin family protein [Flavobacterium sp.]
MKKILLTAVAVFGFAFANAQETKFGAKAGLNLSNVTGDNTDDNKMKVGFQVGAFANIGISEQFAVQPEVLFSTQGNKIDGPGDGSVELNYINIPIMAQYKVADKFTLEAGPQIGFLMSAKLKFDGGSIDVKDQINSTDFGIGVGAGYDVAENINLGLRYTIGVSNLNKEGDDKNANSNLAFAIGYRF